jgi:peptide/nickel transport system substrate-binding protein
MMKAKFRTIVFVLIVLMLIIPAGVNAQDEEPVTFRLGTTYIADSLNPHTFWYGWNIRWLWYDTPVEFNLDNLQFDMALAESYEVSEDELTWTFKVREGITFHDGTPLNAEAIAWSMNYMLQVENSPVSYLWNFDWTPITAIEAVDDMHFAIHSSEPIGNMLYRLSYAYILPKSVWESMPTAEEAKAYEDVLACSGTGAFKCVEWVQDDYLILEANEDHWRGKPPMDQLILMQYASYDALAEALLAGEIDGSYMIGAAVEILEADENIAVVEDSLNEWDSLIFNSTEPCADGQESTDYEPCGTQPASLGDPLIREAIDFAIDREQIAIIGYAGHASPGASVVPPFHGDYHNPDLLPTPWDPDYANSILDEAGYLDSDGDGVREWSDGTPLEYSLITDDSAMYARFAELIQYDLSEIGIAITVELLDSGALSARRNAPAWDFDLWYFSYGSDVDPDFPLITVLCSERYPYGWNYSGYCSEEADANYYASATTIDHDARVQVVHDAAAFLNSERPWIVLVYTNTIAAYRTDRFVGLSNPWIDFTLTLMKLQQVP